jgi:ubiquinone/menaquinone biosynthesis C-methylase UbiE
VSQTNQRRYRALVRRHTANIYSSLFIAYSQKQFDDSVNLFFQRHKRWDIKLDWFRDKICLDAGCGGGRFVVALAKLGARKVYGVDIARDSLTAAQERARERDLTNADFVQASVLSLPFPKNTFDYIVCSGVIHHTPAPYEGFEELSRVLKPGGKLFFSVYGRGGLKWMINDIFRHTICGVLPFHTMETLWKAVGIPANKRYNILDNLYVLFCHRFSEQEIRQWLREAGFENIRRLKFERYDYETVRSRIIHGEGWIQTYADKKQ